MINPHELHSFSQRKLTEWNDKAAMQELAHAAQVREERETQRESLLRQLVVRLSSIRLPGRASLGAR